MSVFVFEFLKLARNFLFITRDGVSFEVEQLMQILLRSVFLAEKFLFEPVQSVFKSSVLFDELNVLLGQVLFVLSQEIDFATLGFFLAETRIGAHIVVWGLLVVETKFFLDEFLFLLGELIVS